MQSEKRKRYWLTPPDVYDKLDREFHFDYDPCPYPRPPDHNGVEVPWGQSNYVNPPFRREDAQHGAGMTAFARKAIAEQQQGKTSVFLLPFRSYFNLLLGAGAEFRDAGRVAWLEVETGEPIRNPSQTVCVILRGKK